MKTRQLIILSLSLFQAISAQASTGERLEHFISLSLEELVNLETTIATNSKRTITNAPAVVTLITADDIKMTGATNLVEVLEGVPGIHVRASHFAFRPLIHFRGANASLTLLMVNGTPMKDLMWGFGIFWKGLPISMIERVEIIRGPGSALFGADASAGVINVITKTAGKIESTEVGVRLGSFNTKTAWMQHGESWNGIDIGLTADLFSTGGHNPLIEIDGQTKSDQNENTNVSYAPGSAQYGWDNEDIRFSIAKDNWRLLADYMQHSDLKIGLTGGGVLDPVTQAKDSRYNIDLLYNNETLNQNWGLDARLNYVHLDYTSGDGFQERPPGYNDGTDTYPIGVINQMRSAERRVNAELSGLYTGTSDHAIRLGVGYTWQDLYSVEHIINNETNLAELIDVSDTADAFAPEKTRKISYLFLQDVWHINDVVELTAGGRYDHYSDFGSAFNPRLAVVWKNSDRLTTKLMYGEAFRAPSYQELFATTSNALPNTQLDPERSQTLDLAFAYVATKDLQLNLNLFHFKQTELISKVGSPKQFQNTGDHVIRGIELEARWQAAKELSVLANFTARDHRNNEYRSFDQPNQEAYLRLDWGFKPQWNWNMQSNWIGRRTRAAGDERAAVEDYFLTDSTIRHAQSESLEFAISVRNLFDVDAKEYTGQTIPNDLPLPDRNFYAEMRYKF